MKSLRDLFLTILLLIVIGSCAKQSSPGGGPADEDPPVVLKSDPENGSVNFSGNSFEVTFNEFFVINGVDQKLLISPPLENRPTVKARGKTLVVSFDEELRDSVTYTFYFEDAIQDLNENNPIDNFQFVFSTGPTLDSLSVTGTIYNAFDLEPGEGIFVVLYPGSNDTLPVKTIPAYVTRAAKDGRFRIDHITGGEYSIFGLKDVNNNKKYDLQDEGFAFIDTTIVLTPGNNFIRPVTDTLRTASDSLAAVSIPGKEYALFLFTSETQTQYLKASDRDNAYSLMFAFSMPVDSGEMELGFPGFDTVNYMVETSATRDTFMVWLTDSSFYSQPRIPVRLVYQVPDSSGTMVPVVDTIDMRYIAPRPIRGAPVKSDQGLKITTNISARKGLTPGKKIYFGFETPQAMPDTSFMKLFVRKDTLMLPQDYTLVMDTVNLRKFFMETNLEQDSSYFLIAEKGAFKDIYGSANDSIAWKFVVRNEESFGSLIIHLSGYQGDIILQLLTEDEKIVNSSAINSGAEKTVRFPYLEPGAYRLKIIFDINGDGKWTTGDYSIKRAPEPVTYYPDPINVKVLWTIEQDWEISSIREKSDALRNPAPKKGSTGRTTRTTGPPAGSGGITRGTGRM